MQTHTAGRAPTVSDRRLSPGVWVAAIAEVAVAFVVATIILRTGHSSSLPDMPDMPGMEPQAAHIHWQATTIVAAVVTAAALAWWAATRARVASVLAAAGLVGIGASDEVRTLSLQSHLVAMATREALLVAAPLLLIAAAPPRSGAVGSRSAIWTAFVVSAVAMNSALLIALHLPAVHDRGMNLASVPLWLAAVVAVVGLSYWAAILLTAGRVAPAVRRGALIIGQEVAAILGLAALIHPTSLHPASTLGLSPAVDGRLGGILMLITCAAVTLPLAKRPTLQQLRTEHHVH